MHKQLQMRLAMLLALMLTAFAAFADAYRPNSQVKSYITVRSKASASAKEIARIKKAEIFEVTEISHGWGKVVTESGSVGYVNAKFIERVPDVAIADQAPANHSISWMGGKYNLHWMVWLILALMIAVFILQKCDLEGYISIWVTPIIWFLLGASQLAYIALCRDPFWTQANLGWLAILIAFAVFAVGAFYQTGSMIGFAKTYSEDNAIVGIWSVPVCVVAGIILNYTAPNYIAWVFVAFALAQLWQAFVIFRTVYQYQDAGLATVSAVGYLFGMLGTLIMATLLVALVIVVVVCLFCLWLVLSMIGSDTKNIRLTHKWGDYFTDQYGDEWEHIGGNAYRRT